MEENEKKTALDQGNEAGEGVKSPVTKEDKAKLIARNMASVSFDGEATQDKSEKSQNEALRKVNEAVNNTRSYDRGAIRATGTEERDMSQVRRKRPDGARAPQRRDQGQRRSTDPHRRPQGAKRRPVRRKKKSKAPLIICLSLLGVMVLGLAVAYIVGVNKYKGVFLDNTFINNIDVSSKSKEEAYKMVKEKSQLKDSITIVRLGGEQISIPLKEIGYEDKTQYEIEKFYNSQNHYNWVASKFKNTQFELEEKFDYDKALLEAQLKKQMTATGSGKDPIDATIQKSTDGSGYVIVKEKPGDKINLDKIKNLYDFVEKSLDKGTFIVDVAEVDCYETAKITADSLKEKCDKLNKMFNFTITIDFTYAQEQLTGDMVMNWVTFDDKADNGIAVDMKQVETYVEGLSKKYDTYGKDREFKTTKKGVITIKGGKLGENDSGSYGWWMDQEKTMELIANLIREAKNAKVKPVYYTWPNDQNFTFTCDESVRTAEKDWGNTYIEIDLVAQHLWYYKDGKVAMESDIVSGLDGDYNRYTREGVFKVFYKERNKVLRGNAGGATWASPTTYWTNMSLYGAGLHDASWQYGVFGGTKYKYAGTASHGCINMPLDKAKYVFDNVPMNTPVFIYKIDKAAAGAATKPN